MSAFLKTKKKLIYNKSYTTSLFSHVKRGSMSVYFAQHLLDMNTGCNNVMAIEKYVFPTFPLFYYGFNESWFEVWTTLGLYNMDMTYHTKYLSIMSLCTEKLRLSIVFWKQLVYVKTFIVYQFIFQRQNCLYYMKLLKQVKEWVAISSRQSSWFY